MVRAWWIAVVMTVFPSVALAEDCPDFFRFVDFGLVAADGTVTRGGTILRGESFEGTTLVAPRASVCRELRDIGRDGHGNPIPVVETVVYDPAKTGLDVTALAVTDLGDSLRAAEEAAADHRARLARSDATVTKGERALCADDGGTVSCQVVSPYKGTAPIVVYCDAAACRLPVLAIDARLGISAEWSAPGDGGMPGNRIAAMVQDIHDFLAPLTSLARN